jgi:hypothetical protein
LSFGFLFYHARPDLSTPPAEQETFSIDKPGISSISKIHDSFRFLEKKRVSPRFSHNPAVF